mgnify:CR=1 FL=1
MYGTVALLRVQPGRAADMVEEVRAEDQDAHMPGYIAQYVYRMDAEPDLYWLVVLFQSRETYQANAASPEQHARYLRLRALLTEDPQWHDGEIVYPSPA